MMNEFDILKECLPLADNLTKYLCVKTKINHFSDFEFPMNTSLDKTVRKFAHSGWLELKPLVVGIKCYLNDQTEGAVAYVDVFQNNRAQEKSIVLESIAVKNEMWYQFKYPLLEAYHTTARISLSQNVSAFTLAILNGSTYVREKHHTNYFPEIYNSYEQMYNSTNAAIVYVDETGKELDPNKEKNIPKYLIYPN